jgi:DNA polymerase elongation subunit (family B)
VDINSLYPSAIRALNISPETIVGQLRPTETKALIAERIASGTKRAEAWDGIFNSVEFQHMLDQSGAKVTVDFDDGTTREMSGRQLNDYIFDPGTSSASRPTGPSSARTRRASSRCCWPNGI